MYCKGYVSSSQSDRLRLDFANCSFNQPTMGRSYTCCTDFDGIAIDLNDKTIALTDINIAQTRNSLIEDMLFETSIQRLEPHLLENICIQRTDFNTLSF